MGFVGVMASHIDMQALQSIAALQRPGKPDLLGRVVGLFESETPKLIQAINSGLESGDIDAVRNSAHTLKSSSAYVGAKTVSTICREMERAARESNLLECHVLNQDLEDEFQQALVELQQHMKKSA